MASFFISHSSKDNQVASEVRDALKSHGFESLFLDFDPEDGIPSGSKWEGELYSKLRATDAVIFLSSPDALASRWCFAELALARSLNRKIFPLAFDGKAGNHPLLIDTQWINVSADGARRFERLWTELRRAGFDPTDSLAWDPLRPPYPGLDAFEAADAAVFFGRKEKIDELRSRLQPTLEHGTGHFVAVIGASGSGKSSLVRAGLIPRLERERWVVVPPFKPGESPVSALARELAHALGKVGRTEDWRDLEVRLRESPDDLRELARDLSYSGSGPPTSVLLVVDQAEELMVIAEEKERACFAAILSSALEPPTPLWVVATFRSEFLTKALEQRVIAERIEASVLVPPLDDARLAEVIVGPAQKAGLYFERGLVGHMVEDARGGGLLPLLAYTLRELYEQAGPDGRIRALDYEHVGGVLGALRDAANRVMDELGRQGKGELVLPTMLKLTALDATNAPTRRRVSRSELGPDENEIVEAFIAARLLKSDRKEEDPKEGTVEVAHEALFREWPPLTQAIEDSREHLRVRSELERLGKEWEEAGRTDAYLLRDERLERARRVLGWRPTDSRVALSQLDWEFMSASVAEARKRYRAKRLAQAGVWVVAVLLLLALIASLIAIRKISNAQQQTERQRNRAEHEARIATSRLLASDAVRSLDRGFLYDALQLGSAATRVEPTTQARSVLIRALTDNPYLSTILPGESAMALSEDGKTLVTGRARRLTVWDVPTQSVQSSLKIPYDPARIALSPNGDLIATANGFGVLRLWSVPRREAIGNVLPGRLYGSATPLVFAKGGHRLISAARGSLLIWRLKGEHARLSRIRLSSLSKTFFFRMGSEAVAWVHEGQLHVWDLRQHREIVAPTDGPLRSNFAYGISGSKLAWIQRNTLVIWDITRRRTVATHSIDELGDGNTMEIGMSVEAQTVAVLDDQGAVQLVHPASQAPSRSLYIGGMGEIAMSNDGRVLASFAGLPPSVRVWDLTRSYRFTEGLSAQPVGKLAFSPDGRRLAARVNGGATVWELSTRRKRSFRVPTAGGGLTAMSGGRPELADTAFVDADSDIAFAGADTLMAAHGGQVFFWDLEASQSAPRVTIKPRVNGMQSIAASADGHIAIAGHSGAVAVTRLSDGQGFRYLPSPAQDTVTAIYDVAFDGTGQFLAVLGERVNVWDTRTYRRMSLFRPYDGIGRIALSKNGKMLAITPGGDWIELWDVEKETQIGSSFEVPEIPVHDLAFSADNRTLAAVTGDFPDGAVRLWDVSDYAELGTIPMYRGDLSSIAFSPRGHTLAIGGENGVQILNLDTESLLRAACRIASNNLSRNEWREIVGNDEPYRKACPDL